MWGDLTMWSRVPSTRRACLALHFTLSFTLAACGGDGPVRTSFPPASFEYLTRLQLNVATVDYAPLPPPGPLDDIAPLPPGPSLLQLARERLTAAGNAGHATVTVSDATLVRAGDRLLGSMALRVEVFGADETRLAFTEAQVRRQATGIGRDTRGALYDLVRQMLDDMNVELEYQARQNLRDQLQTPQTAPAPAPVEQQDLGAPPSL